MPRIPIAASCPPPAGWSATAAAAPTKPRASRVDDGVAEGGEVSMFYDPMIAKLITWAPTREEAIDRQIAALDAFQIDGLGHNIDFLSALMQHPRFRAGDLTTGFIAEEYPEGFHGAPADAELLADLAVDRRAGRAWRRMPRRRGQRPAERQCAARGPGRPHRRRRASRSASSVRRRPARLSSTRAGRTS